ncbi:MAG TPA: PAS domain S-box protein [Bacteroidia bacterium]|jgi:PAS domain S-box-containing protein
MPKDPEDFDHSLIDYRALFESAHGLYLILHPDLTIVAVSDAYLIATMTKRELILGRRLFDVFPDNPDDPNADGVSRLRASLDYVLEKKKPQTMAVQKYDIRRPDGSFEVRYWSPQNKPVLDEKKEVKYIIHRVEDVSGFIMLQEEQAEKDKIAENMRVYINNMNIEMVKRAKEIQEMNTELEQMVAERTAEVKRTEKRYRALIEHSFDAIILNSADGTPVYQSPSTERMLGWTLEERSGEKGFSLLHPDDRESFSEVLKKVIQFPGKAFGSIHRMKHKDGHYLWTEGMITNLLDDPAICAVVSNFRDITGRKKAEEAIARTLSLTTFQKKQLEDFCNIISHNLRSPLVNISMLVDFITQSSDKEEQQMLTEKLTIATANLNEIFNELVESLQIREDTEVRSEKLSVEEYTQKTLDVLSGQINLTEAVIEKKFEEPFITFPPKYLASIIQNLMSNALKYREPSRKPVIKVSTKRSGSDIILAVSDNGLGLDMKKHGNNLFKIRKVFHYHPEAKGFGLFITKAQVEAMGGRIWAESEPGKGATFYVQFKDQQS